MLARGDGSLWPFDSTNHYVQINNNWNYTNTYTYTNDRITQVAHNTTGDTTDVTYNFAYDALGRKTTVKVCSQTLSTNTYESDRNGLLSSVTYDNGGKVKYTYDDFDRIIGVTMGQWGQWGRFSLSHVFTKS